MVTVDSSLLSVSAPSKFPLEKIRQTLLDFNLDAIETVSLSGNACIDGDTLKDILTKHPTPKCLHLLDTPQLELKTKLDMARRFSLSEVLDTFIVAPFRDTREAAA